MTRRRFITAIHLLVVLATCAGWAVYSARGDMTKSQRLQKLLADCKDDHVRFGWSILGRSGDRGYWSKQREVCRSVRDVKTTVVPAGNAVGKSYVGSGIVASYLLGEPNSLIFTSAPSQSQLEGVLWKEIKRLHKTSLIPLGGKISGSAPIVWDMGEGWMAYGHVSNSVERMSGHHAKRLLAVIDEASGVSDAVYQAVDSLNPDRKLLLGNPLRPSGQFFDLCQRADDGDKTVRKITIPSTESPDIHLERSPRGMADASWLEDMRAQYGERSIWWLSHVLALFPGEADDTLILRAWLNLAGHAIYVPSGPRRLAIDLGEGVGGGDQSVCLVRDDNGVLDLQYSRDWSLEATATKAALLCQKWGIEPRHVSWDAGGIGADFMSRLESLNIRGARPYKGAKKGERAANLRSAAAWLLRLRLDPEHYATVPGTKLRVKQQPFAIPPEFLRLIRPELQDLRYQLDNQGRIELEAKELLVERLKHSPDFADALIQSFAFPGV